MNATLRSRTLARFSPSRIHLSATRRFASHDHGHHEVPGGGNERIGSTFFFVAGLVPASLLLYAFVTPSKGEEPVFTKLLRRWSNYEEEWAQTNLLHSQALQRAAADKNLFYGTPKSQHVELRFPEIFNTGSQINVRAGFYPDISEVIDHYKKKNKEQEEKTYKRMQQLKELGIE